MSTLIFYFIYFIVYFSILFISSSLCLVSIHAVFLFLLCTELWNKNSVNKLFWIWIWIWMDEIQQGIVCDNPMDFWRSREAIYSRIAPVVLDLVSAPASQAFLERIFSMCGLLSSGLRNWTMTSLEQPVLRKINKKLFRIICTKAMCWELYVCLCVYMHVCKSSPQWWWSFQLIVSGAKMQP